MTGIVRWRSSSRPDAASGASGRLIFRMDPRRRSAPIPRAPSSCGFIENRTGHPLRSASTEASSSPGPSWSTAGLCGRSSTWTADWSDFGRRREQTVLMGRLRRPPILPCPQDQRGVRLLPPLRPGHRRGHRRPRRGSGRRERFAVGLHRFHPRGGQPPCQDLRIRGRRRTSRSRTPGGPAPP
ncbi:MAG: hypothetical protein MZU97_12210 [Bacillus subtilis]|nr:hypothetical protein [Bacillus subtilis]